VVTEKGKISNEIIDKLKEAEKVYVEIDSFLKEHIKEGESILYVVESVENMILEKDLGLAFPFNLSINNIAAHDTAMENDGRCFKNGDVVKVDIGVHFDGYIIDSAKTYIVGENEEGKIIKEISEKIIREVKKALHIGMRINEIGEIIESIVSREEKGIVANLTGHSLGRYMIHGGISIPNIKNDLSYEISYGDMIAIEPFIASTSSNIIVKDHPRIEIYEISNQNAHVRDRLSNILWNEIKKKYGNGLPFAKRWLNSLHGFMKTKALNELVKVGALYSYPVLYYPSDKVFIAQSEITAYFLDKVHFFGFKF